LTAKGIRTLTIPVCVTSIGEQAFSYNELASVTIGASVTDIGQKAFYNKRLTSVEIPNSVVMIGPEAFAQNSIKTIVMPKRIYEMGQAAFDPAVMQRVKQVCRVDNAQTTPSSASRPWSQTTTLTTTRSQNSIQTRALTRANNPALSIDHTISQAPLPGAGQLKPGASSATAMSGAQITTFSSGATMVQNPNEAIFPTLRGGLGPTGAPPDAGNADPVGWRDNARYTGSYFSQDSYYNDYDPNDNYAQGNYERYGWGANAVASAKGYDTNRGYSTTAFRPLPSPGTPEFKVDVQGNLATAQHGEITKYNGYPTSVNIPGKVNSVPIHTIGTAAFMSKQLTEVYIPDGVSAIGDAAFSTNLLRSVFIPDSVRFIGNQSFGGNPLTEVSIGENVNIREDSFPQNFYTVYLGNAKQAGTYTNNGGNWAYTGL
jgi:hypothetical protein